MRHSFVRRSISLSIVSLLSAIAFAAIPFTGIFQEVASSAAQPQSADLVQFPEVGLAIAQPKGFEKAETFHGFQQPSTQSSILLISLPGPFAEVTKGFNADNLSARGLKLLSRTDMQINNQPGILVQLAQTAYGQDFLKWTAIFGDAQKTHIITATYPQASAKDVGDTLKQIVLSVSVAKDVPSGNAPSGNALQPDAERSFTVTPAPGLKPAAQAASLGKIIALTQNGKLTQTSPNNPLMIITPSLGAVPIVDQKAYALGRLKQTSQIQVQTVQATTPITIDGLDGYEILATGKDIKTGLPLQLYQVMLFPEAGGYVLMTAQVGKKSAALYLPKFKATARTYHQNVSK